MAPRAAVSFPLRLTTLAVSSALSAAAGAAEDDDLTRLTKPESSISVGAGYLDRDGRRFGQYTGVRDNGAHLLLDADIVNRDDATGTWLKLRARDLGLESRELRFDHNRQGNWGYFIEYSRTPRYEPYLLNSAVRGIGTGTLSVPAVSTAGGPIDLKTVRDAFTFGFDKILAGNFSLQVRFKNEDKDGARLFARGTTGPFQLVPEPINSTTRQLEAIASYSGKDLQLSGGYYGTTYNNQYNGLAITEFGGPATALAGFTPIGLPPDNHSHQLHLSGGYNFTPTTRGTFKLAYGRIAQTDAFVTGVPLAPGIGNNLGGKIETTFAQAGMTARPFSKLSLLANVRYENRDDKTPVLTYFTGPFGGTSTTDGKNEPRSHESKFGRLEASYVLPAGFRLTGGLDYEERQRNTSDVRVVSYRERTEETSWRVEIRRSLSDTINGALAYVRSDRDGSPFLNTVTFNGAAGSNVIAPLHLADRERDKWRLMLDFTPTDALSVQFFYDEAQDTYGSRTTQNLGPRSGRARNYSLDASLTVSDNVQLTAWYSQNDNRADQATRTSGGQLWAAQLRNQGDAYGLGLRAKPAGRLELGADLQVSDITDEFRQAAITGAAIASLPDITTRITTLKLFARYEVRKDLALRLNYVYDRWSSNDWTWSSWTYSDGSRLTQTSPQRVHFIGVAAMYSWR